MEDIDSAVSVDSGAGGSDAEAVPNVWEPLTASRALRVLELEVPAEHLVALGAQRISAVLVSDTGSQFWLVVPGAARPRRRNQRLVPSAWEVRAFASRVISEEAAADDALSEYVPVALVLMRAVARPFLGLADAGVVEGVTMFLNEEGEPSLPEAVALLKACQPKLDEPLPGRAGPVLPEAALSGRVEAVERSVDAMRQMLEGYFGPPPAGPGDAAVVQVDPPEEPAYPAAAGKPPLATAVPKRAGVPSGGVALDAAVLRSAQAAGVSPERLAGLAQLLQGPTGRLPPEPGVETLKESGVAVKRTRAGDPRPGHAAGADDDGLDGEELSIGGEELSPVERALVHLTKITGQLAARGQASADPLERALEGLSGSVSTEGATSNLSIRKGAAARRALVEAVTARPAAIYGPVERLMVEAIRGGPASQAVGVGSDLETPNAFVYLEHRSRVSNYRTTVCWLWQLAAIHKALVDGKPDVARARAALALAAGEQFSIDQGSWTLAWEVTLLDEPPFDAFARHATEGGRMPSSRLIDPRWLEVHLARLRDQDDMMERRRRLQGHSTPHADAGLPGAEPKPKAPFRPKDPNKPKLGVAGAPPGSSS